jgi:hypothetical protein
MRAQLLDLLRQMAIACLATITAVITRWLYEKLNIHHQHGYQQQQTWRTPV